MIYSGILPSKLNHKPIMLSSTEGCFNAARKNALTSSTKFGWLCMQFTAQKESRNKISFLFTI